jgi:hypothetical protein
VAELIVEMVQVWPESVVFAAASSPELLMPTATQSFELAQDTPETVSSAGAGSGSVNH